MIGKQIIYVNDAFTLNELAEFMNKVWDKERYNDFCIGRPTAYSIEEYILLPATINFMVIIYPHKVNSLLHNKNQIILSVCNTAKGAKRDLTRSIPSHKSFLEFGKSILLCPWKKKEKDWRNKFFKNIRLI